MLASVLSRWFEPLCIDRKGAVLLSKQLADIGGPWNSLPSETFETSAISTVANKQKMPRGPLALSEAHLHISIFYMVPQYGTPLH